MTILGERKQAYCSICGRETEWEYIETQLDDGFFGLLRLIWPTKYNVKHWRCCSHTTEEGRVKEDIKQKHIHPPKREASKA